MNPQAKGLSMIVYRAPEGVDPLPALGRGEQVRVPMKGRTVREWRSFADCEAGVDRWTSADDDPYYERLVGGVRYGDYMLTFDPDGSMFRERPVAPIQPATPCPCGDGFVLGDDPAAEDPLSVPMVLVSHEPCDGSGWVGGDLGLVTEQWRALHEPSGLVGEWESDMAAAPSGRHTDFTVERRLVVPWRTQVTELLPVTDDRRCRAGSVLLLGGDVLHVLDTYSEAVTDEPWAQHLTPGMFVATLVGLWPIDPPVVDMPCPMPDAMEDNPTALDNGVCGTCDGTRRVPLSVTPGEAVEL